MNTADTIRELRAARPVAETGLRLRVRAIAAETPPRRAAPRAWLAGWRRGVLIAAPAAAALALATAGAIGLARSGDGSGDRLAAESPERDLVQTEAGSPGLAAGQSKAAPSLGSAAAPGTGSAALPTGDRAQRYSAALTLEVADTDTLSDATQGALRIARELGGFASSVSYASAESGTASLTLRIPTARVQDAIARLSQLGTIVTQQVQIDDLQEELEALRSRQTALRARVARLTAELQVPDLAPTTRATLEQQRRRARAALAETNGSVRATVEQAELATLQLGLQTDEAAAVPPPPSRLGRAIEHAVGVLAWEAVALLFLAILASPLVATAAAVAAWRHVARRRSEADLLAAH